MQTKRNIVVYSKLLFLILSVIIIAESRGQDDYNIVERFKLNEDRVRTYEMMNSFGHDFIFGVTGMLNADITDVIDDVDAAEKANDLASAQAFLVKYEKTEQNARFSIDVGAPLPSFSLFKAKVRPSVRFNGNLGTMIGIRRGQVTIGDLASSIKNVPQAVKDAIASCNFGTLSDGDDIVQVAFTNGCITAPQRDAIGLGQYLFQESNTSVPVLYAYAKAEARLGLNFDYVKGKHWFGNFSLYGLGRADYTQIVTAQSLAGNADVADFPDEMNTTMNMVTDFRLGYRNKNLRGWASIEEIKLATVSDNEEAGGELVYGNDPLFRLHGEYLYRFHGFSIKPFLGVHKRSGYGFDDGLYVGSDVGLHFWGNRLGVRARGMLDKEHLTISPQLKLWMLHLDYMLKVPVKSEVSGVKPATIHSLNLRFFI